MISTGKNGVWSIIHSDRVKRHTAAPQLENISNGENGQLTKTPCSAQCFEISTVFLFHAHLLDCGKITDWLTPSLVTGCPTQSSLLVKMAICFRAPPWRQEVWWIPKTKSKWDREIAKQNIWERIQHGNVAQRIHWWISFISPASLVKPKIRSQNWQE